MGRVVTGKTPPTAKPELFGSEYPFITPTDIDGVQRKATTARFISEQGRNSQRNLLLPANTVCVVCIGATIGKISLTDKPSFTNQQINSVIVNESKHDPLFAYYALKAISPNLISLAGGAATPILNKSSFSEVGLDVPSLTEQRRIAAILSVYDDLIENNTRRIGILEEMARRIYEEWFVRFRFPGHEYIPLVESILGLIPQGWKKLPLADIAEEVRRTVEPNTLDSTLPYVGLEHIPRRSIALGDWGTAADVQSTKLIFKTGEILFGKIRPYFHKVVIAPTDGVCSTDAIVIIPKREEWLPITLATVSSDLFVQHATQTSNGVNMPRANWTELLKYPVLIAPENIQKKFDDLILSSITQIKNLIFKNRNLRRTRDLLLPKLISGAIDVSEFPEPSELTTA